MRSKPKAYAIGVIVLEVLCCLLIYLCCVYIRRRRCGHKLRDIFWSLEGGVVGVNSPRIGIDSSLLVYFSISALKGFHVVKTRRIGCTSCLSEFNSDDETLRLMPKCGHVFHPLCLIDPCSPLCPCCNDVTFESNRSNLRSNDDENKPMAMGEAIGEVEKDVEAKDGAIVDTVNTEVKDAATNKIDTEVKDESNSKVEAEVETMTEAEVKAIDEIEVGAEVKATPTLVIEGAVKATDLKLEIRLLKEKVITKLPKEIMEKIIRQAKVVLPTGEVYSKTRYLW